MSDPSGVTLTLVESTVGKKSGALIGKVTLEARISNWDTWEEILGCLEELDIYANEDIKTQVISAMKEDRDDKKTKFLELETSTSRTISILKESLEHELGRANTLAWERDQVKKDADRLVLDAAQWAKDNRRLVIRVAELQRQLVDCTHEDSCTSI